MRREDRRTPRLEVAPTARLAMAWDGLLLVGAVFLFIYAGKYHALAPTGQVGPELWPRMALGLMAVFAAIDLLLRWRTTPPESAKAPLQISVDGLSVVAAMIVLILYLVFFPILGFLFTNLLLIPAILTLSGYRNTLVIILCTLVAPPILAYLFQHVLGVVFPLGAGFFGAWTNAIYHSLGIF